MQPSQIQNVGLPSCADTKRDVPAWMQDPKIFPLDWFSVNLPNIIRQAKEYVSELSKWRNCATIETLSRLKAVLKRIMMSLHTHISYIDSKSQSLLQCDLEEDLTTLVSLYMDMELRVLKIKKKKAAEGSKASLPPNDADTARNDEIVSDRISYWLYTMLTGHDQRVDALLSTTVYSRHTRPVLDPIFRKILNDMPDGPYNAVNYVRHVLAYKTWRERTLVKNDEISDELNTRTLQRLVPCVHEFPEPLLKCLGNANLADACRSFMRFCREMPAAAAEQINFESIPLLDDDILGEEENEINNIMNMISSRKQEKSGSASPRNNFEIEAFIDLTLPRAKPESNHPSQFVIDLTEEDEEPTSKSLSNSLRHPPSLEPPTAACTQRTNTPVTVQSPQDCSHDFYFVNISCMCPFRAHHHSCQDKNKPLKSSTAEQKCEKGSNFVGRCLQFSIGKHGNENKPNSETGKSKFEMKPSPSGSQECYDELFSDDLNTCECENRTCRSAEVCGESDNKLSCRNKPLDICTQLVHPASVAEMYAMEKASPIILQSQSSSNVTETLDKRKIECSDFSRNIKTLNEIKPVFDTEESSYISSKNILSTKTNSLTDVCESYNTEKCFSSTNNITFSKENGETQHIETSTDITNENTMCCIISKFNEEETNAIITDEDLENNLSEEKLETCRTQTRNLITETQNPDYSKTRTLCNQDENTANEDLLILHEEKRGTSSNLHEEKGETCRTETKRKNLECSRTPPLCNQNENDENTADKDVLNNLLDEKRETSSNLHEEKRETSSNLPEEKRETSENLHEEKRETSSNLPEENSETCRTETKRKNRKCSKTTALCNQNANYENTADINSLNDLQEEKRETSSNLPEENSETCRTETKRKNQKCSKTTALCNQNANYENTADINSLNNRLEEKREASKNLHEEKRETSSNFHEEKRETSENLHEEKREISSNLPEENSETCRTETKRKNRKCSKTPALCNQNANYENTADINSLNNLLEEKREASKNLHEEKRETSSNLHEEKRETSENLHEEKRETSSNLPEENSETCRTETKRKNRKCSKTPALCNQNANYENSADINSLNNLLEEKREKSSNLHEEKREISSNLHGEQRETSRNLHEEKRETLKNLHEEKRETSSNLHEEKRDTCRIEPKRENLEGSKIPALCNWNENAENITDKGSLSNVSEETYETCIAEIQNLITETESIECSETPNSTNRQKTDENNKESDLLKNYLPEEEYEICRTQLQNFSTEITNFECSEKSSSKEREETDRNITDKDLLQNLKNVSNEEQSQSNISEENKLPTDENLLENNTSEEQSRSVDNELMRSNIPETKQNLEIVSEEVLPNNISEDTRIEITNEELIRSILSEENSMIISEEKLSPSGVLKEIRVEITTEESIQNLLELNSEIVSEEEVLRKDISEETRIEITNGELTRKNLLKENSEIDPEEKLLRSSISEETRVEITDKESTRNNLSEEHPDCVAEEELLRRNTQEETKIELTDDKSIQDDILEENSEIVSKEELLQRNHQEETADKELIKDILEEQSDIVSEDELLRRNNPEKNGTEIIGEDNPSEEISKILPEEAPSSIISEIRVEITNKEVVRNNLLEETLEIVSEEELLRRNNQEETRIEITDEELKENNISEENPKIVSEEELLRRKSQEDTTVEITNEEVIHNSISEENSETVSEEFLRISAKFSEEITPENVDNEANSEEISQNIENVFQERTTGICKSNQNDEFKDVTESVLTANVSEETNDTKFPDAENYSAENMAPEIDFTVESEIVVETETEISAKETDIPESATEFADQLVSKSAQNLLHETLLYSVPEISHETEITSNSTSEETKEFQSVSEISTEKIGISLESFPDVPCVSEITINPIPEISNETEELELFSENSNKSGITVNMVPEISSETEIASISVPEISNETEIASISIPEISNETEIASISIPEISNETEVTSISVPEISNENEVTSFSVPEISNETEIASISVPEISNETEIASIAVPEIPNETEIASISTPQISIEAAFEDYNTTCNKFAVIDDKKLEREDLNESVEENFAAKVNNSTKIDETESKMNTRSRKTSLSTHKNIQEQDYPAKIDHFLPINKTESEINIRKQKSTNVHQKDSFSKDNLLSADPKSKINTRKRRPHLTHVPQEVVLGLKNEENSSHVSERKRRKRKTKEIVEEEEQIEITISEETNENINITVVVSETSKSKNESLTENFEPPESNLLNDGTDTSTKEIVSAENKKIVQEIGEKIDNSKGRRKQNLKLILRKEKTDESENKELYVVCKNLNKNEIQFLQKPSTESNADEFMEDSAYFDSIKQTNPPSNTKTETILMPEESESIKIEDKNKLDKMEDEKEKLRKIRTKSRKSTKLISNAKQVENIEDDLSDVKIKKTNERLKKSSISKKIKSRNSGTKIKDIPEKVGIPGKLEMSDEDVPLAYRKSSPQKINSRTSCVFGNEVIRSEDDAPSSSRKTKLVKSTKKAKSFCNKLEKFKFEVRSKTDSSVEAQRECEIELKSEIKSQKDLDIEAIDEFKTENKSTKYLKTYSRTSKPKTPVLFSVPEAQLPSVTSTANIQEPKIKPKKLRFADQVNNFDAIENNHSEPVKKAVITETKPTEILFNNKQAAISQPKFEKSPDFCLQRAEQIKIKKYREINTDYSDYCIENQKISSPTAILNCSVEKLSDNNVNLSNPKPNTIESYRFPLKKKLNLLPKTILSKKAKEKVFQNHMEPVLENEFVEHREIESKNYQDLQENNKQVLSAPVGQVKENLNTSKCKIPLNNGNIFSSKTNNQIELNKEVLIPTAVQLSSKFDDSFETKSNYEEISESDEQPIEIEPKIRRRKSKFPKLKLKITDDDLFVSKKLRKSPKLKLKPRLKKTKLKLIKCSASNIIHKNECLDLSLNNGAIRKEKNSTGDSNIKMDPVLQNSANFIDQNIPTEVTEQIKSTQIDNRSNDVLYRSSKIYEKHFDYYSDKDEASNSELVIDTSADSSDTDLDNIVQENKNNNKILNVHSKYSHSIDEIVNLNGKLESVANNCYINKNINNNFNSNETHEIIKKKSVEKLVITEEKSNKHIAIKNYKDTDDYKTSLMVKQHTTTVVEVTEEICQSLIIEATNEDNPKHCILPNRPSVEMLMNIEVGFESLTFSQENPLQVEHAKEGCVKCSVNGKHKNNKKVTVLGLHEYQNTTEESLDQCPSIPHILYCQAVENFEPNSCNLTPVAKSVTVLTDVSSVSDDYNLYVLANIAMNSVHLDTKNENKTVAEFSTGYSNDIKNQSPMHKGESCFVVTFEKNLPESSKPGNDISIINSNNEMVSVNVKKIAGSVSPKGVFLENKIQALKQNAKNGKEKGENLDELYKSLENLCQPEMNTLSNSPTKSIPAEPVSKIPEPIPIDIPKTVLNLIPDDDDDFIVGNKSFDLQSSAQGSSIKTSSEITTTDKKSDNPAEIKDIYEDSDSIASNQEVKNNGDNSIKEIEEPRTRNQKVRAKSDKSSNLNNVANLLAKYKNRKTSDVNSEQNTNKTRNTSITSSPPKYIRSTRPMKMGKTVKRVIENNCSSDEPKTKVSTSEELFDKLLEEHKKENKLDTERTVGTVEKGLPLFHFNASPTNFVNQEKIEQSTNEEEKARNEETSSEMCMEDLTLENQLEISEDSSDSIQTEEHTIKRNESAIKVVQAWFSRGDNKEQSEPYAEVRSDQTIEECNFFEEISSTSENSPNARKADEKMFNEHHTPDSGIAFDEDSTQKDKSVPDNSSDGDTCIPAIKTYFCSSDESDLGGTISDIKIVKPSDPNLAVNAQIKVSIALEKIKNILPLLKLQPDRKTKERPHATESEKPKKRKHEATHFNTEDSSCNILIKEIKRRKHSIDDQIGQECVVEQISSPGPSQKEVSSPMLTKGAVKEYPDCLFGITESPILSGSFHSPYPSDISQTEEPVFYEDYPYYDSFEVFNEQQTPQKDHSVVDENPKEDVQQGLEAAYCVVDSQHFLPLSEYNADYIFIDNKRYNDQSMLPVNMQEVQPENKPHNDDEIKRNEFDDYEKDDGRSEALEEIRNPDLFGEQSTSELEVINMDTSEVELVIACDAYQDTGMTDTYLVGISLQSDAYSNSNTSANPKIIELNDPTPDPKIDQLADAQPSTSKAQFCDTTSIPTSKSVDIATSVSVPEPVATANKNIHTNVSHAFSHKKKSEDKPIDTCSSRNINNENKDKKVKTDFSIRRLSISDAPNTKSAKNYLDKTNHGCISSMKDNSTIFQKPPQISDINNKKLERKLKTFDEIKAASPPPIFKDQKKYDSHRFKEIQTCSSSYNNIPQKPYKARDSINSVTSSVHQKFYQKTYPKPHSSKPPLDAFDRLKLENHEVVPPSSRTRHTSSHPAMRTHYRRDVNAPPVKPSWGSQYHNRKPDPRPPRPAPTKPESKKDMGRGSDDLWGNPLLVKLINTANKLHFKETLKTSFDDENY